MEENDGGGGAVDKRWRMQMVDAAALQTVEEEDGGDGANVGA